MFESYYSIYQNVSQDISVYIRIEIQEDNTLLITINSTTIRMTISQARKLIECIQSNISTPTDSAVITEVIGSK